MHQPAPDGTPLVVNFGGQSVSLNDITACLPSRYAPGGHQGRTPRPLPTITNDEVYLIYWMALAPET